jgi:hypothetical protein
MKAEPMIIRLSFAISVAWFLTPATPLLAAEHPRPPIQRLPQVTTTSPQNTPIKEVSNADIAAGIKRNIDSERKKSGDNKFHINYRGKDLALDLIKVHNDRLSSLGGAKYFACVDMKATDGTVYDIDFFMAGQPGSMKVTETSVHKINGKPLYNWKEEGGIWKKVRVS